MNRFIFCFLFTSILSFSQEIKLLENVIFGPNTKLIGVHALYDKDKTYENLNFYIDDASVLDSLANLLVYSNQMDKNIIEKNSFSIYLIDNFKRVNYWLISPKFNSLSYKGKSYQFNTEIIKELSEKYPLNYYSEKKKFTGSEDFETHLNVQKLNPNFIHFYSPEFKFEGKFELSFPKNDTYTSPKVIIELLEIELLKIVDSKEYYHAVYILDTNNMNNRSQFTITIESSKKVFDQLKIGKLKNKNWTLNEPEGTFFYKQF